MLDPCPALSRHLRPLAMRKAAVGLRVDMYDPLGSLGANNIADRTFE